MKCAFCGYEFSQDEGIEECRGCPIANCNLIRCPNCGYEILPEPELVKRWKRWFKHENK